MIRIVLDLVLGPRCRYGCGHRVYPKNVTEHYRFIHGWAVR